MDSKELWRERERERERMCVCDKKVRAHYGTAYCSIGGCQKIDYDAYLDGAELVGLGGIRDAL